MNLSGLLLGVINIALIAVVLVLVGALIVWFADGAGWAIPQNVQRLYLLVVLLVVLYMMVALLFGLPMLRFVGGASSAVPAVTATIPEPRTRVLR